MIRTDRIGHVVIKVRELERSRKFYSEVLGLQVMKDLPQIPGTFLASKGRDHHEIAKAGHPKAKLVPLSVGNQPRKPGLWKGQLWIADDFDAPLPESILSGFDGDDGEPIA